MGQGMLRGDDAVPNRGLMQVRSGWRRATGPGAGCGASLGMLVLSELSRARCSSIFAVWLEPLWHMCKRTPARTPTLVSQSFHSPRHPSTVTVPALPPVPFPPPLPIPFLARRRTRRTLRSRPSPSASWCAATTRPTRTRRCCGRWTTRCCRTTTWCWPWWGRRWPCR